MADYLYGGANLRARESAIIGRDKLSRLAECRTLDAAYGILAGYGVELSRREDGNGIDREASLLRILQDAYRAAEELAPDCPAIALWRYPYDCNNLKAAIKCYFRRIDPATMLFDFGTVKDSRIVDMVTTGHFEDLPNAMCRAAGEAMDAYAKTRDPQQIDLILDRACYDDMSEAAKKSKNAFVIRLVRARIDLCNFIIAVRVGRMSRGNAGTALLQNALLSGGECSPKQWMETAPMGEESLLQLLQKTSVHELCKSFAPGDALSALERIADNVWMNLVKESKFMPIGLEGMVSFLIAHEYEVKNLRILLASVEAGLDAATIRERMRESYV